MGISGITSSSSAAPPPPIEPPVENSSGGTNVSAGVRTMSDLERVAKPLADAIKYALASNVCSASKRSNDRMKQTLREAERKK